jgi:hypothetical protein
MDKVTQLDQTKREFALGKGLIDDVYNQGEAKLLSEQHGLDWENVKYWAGISERTIKWITVIEIAEIFGVKKTTVYSYIRFEVIPLSTKRINNKAVWDKCIILGCLEAVIFRQNNQYKRGKDVNPRVKKGMESKEKSRREVCENNYNLAANLMKTA